MSSWDLILICIAALAVVVALLLTPRPNPVRPRRPHGEMRKLYGRPPEK